MSIKYINGSGAPRIRIKGSGRVATATYDFPLTGEGGLRERWTSNDVEGESIDLDTLQPSYEWYEGYWTGFFTLDYSATLKNTYLMYIQNISNYQRDGYEVWLTPRIDRPDREFEVKMLNDFEIGINRGGTNAIGNTGTVMNFKTVDSFKYGQWVYGNVDVVVLNNFSVI